MTHSDDAGLVLPPKVAPAQVRPRRTAARAACRFVVAFAAPFSAWFWVWRGVSSGGCSRVPWHASLTMSCDLRAGMRAGMRAGVCAEIVIVACVVEQIALACVLTCELMLCRLWIVIVPVGRGKAENDAKVDEFLVKCTISGANTRGQSVLSTIAYLCWRMCRRAADVNWQRTVTCIRGPAVSLGVGPGEEEPG
eukprot:3854595-Rhodomonas_salina.1